jgi:DNA (cytosine-5)-methyltransferase 1
VQRSRGKYIEPVELVDRIRELIEVIQMTEPIFEQESETNLLFKKRSIPKKQVMALYAINKICSIANGSEQ